MLLLLRLVYVAVLLNGVSPALARKVKRKDNYRLHVPPAPPQPQSPHPLPSPARAGVASAAQPYEFETINHDEFAPPPPPPPLPPSSHHPQISSRYENDYAVLHHSSGVGATGSGGGSDGGGTFLIDNGLRSIAKGSADQATSAVASQNAAGKQASYLAKNTLAQAAAQAAGTAVAALKGKEVLLRRLEEQNIELHTSMEGELAQLQQAKRSAKAAQYSAQQALNHVSVLTAALNNAHSASELAQKSASEAAAELASQIDMVAQAKAKLEQSETHLYAARLDYEETKEAAEKATLSAQAAQINANDAAVHANVELNDSVVHNHHEKRDLNVKQTQHNERRDSKRNNNNNDNNDDNDN